MEWDETQASYGHADTVTALAEAYCSVCEGSFAPGTKMCPVDGTRLVQFQDKSDHLIGRVLDGRFEVLERLGQGGMGDVYRARQQSVGREVAIKVIKPTLSADRASSKRFLREAKLLSRVSQANVVMVHDTGQDEDGTLYLVMELVEGRTLTELMREADERMPVDRIVDIALQICDALEAAHKTGIIHRDLKPSNILIKTSASRRDTVKVLDFGLAKSLSGDESSSTITNTGAVMGTPLYMSPEMITGDIVDARSDLYSLGCVLYEMCTGQPPFIAETSSLLLSKHISEPARPIDRPELGPLAATIEALLQKRAERRPASAAAVAQQLTSPPRAPGASEAVPAGLVSEEHRFDSAGALPSVATTERTAGTRIALISVILLLCGALAAILFFGLGDEPRAADSAPAANDAPPAAQPSATPTPEPAAQPATKDAGVGLQAFDATSPTNVDAASDPQPSASPKDKAHRPRKHRKRRPPKEEKPDVPFLAP